LTNQPFRIQSSYQKKAMMETSSWEVLIQRVRERCEPDMIVPAKILPELPTERA